MPLAWAHAECIKLIRSLHDREGFEQPPQTVKRYLKKKTVSPRRFWQFDHRLRTMPVGSGLRIEVMAPASFIEAPTAGRR